MIKFSALFERWVSIILLGFAMLVVVYQIILLIYNTVLSIELRTEQVGLTYAPEYTKNVAVLFFNILLMLEIMETIKVFAHSHVIKARVILIVCLIAVSRKILALGEHHVDPLVEVAIAALILALSIGYFLVSRISEGKPESKGQDHH